MSFTSFLSDRSGSPAAGALTFDAAKLALGWALRPPIDDQRIVRIAAIQRRAPGVAELWEALLVEGLLPGEWVSPRAAAWLDARVAASGQRAGGRPATAAEVCALAACAPALLDVLPLVEEYRAAAEAWVGDSLGGNTWLRAVPRDQIELLDRRRRAGALPDVRGGERLFPDDWVWGSAEAPLVTTAALEAGLREEMRLDVAVAAELQVEGSLRWCETRAVWALLDAELHARAARAGLRVPHGHRSGYARGCGLSGMLFADVPDPGRALWGVWMAGFGVLRLCTFGFDRGVVLGIPAFPPILVGR